MVCDDTHDPAFLQTGTHAAGSPRPAADRWLGWSSASITALVGGVRFSRRCAGLTRRFLRGLLDEMDAELADDHQFAPGLHVIVTPGPAVPTSSTGGTSAACRRSCWPPAARPTFTEPRRPARRVDHLDAAQTLRRTAISVPVPNQSARETAIDGGWTTLNEGADRWTLRTVVNGCWTTLGGRTPGAVASATGTVPRL